MSKFVPLTADLLVRKGEAAPSAVTPLRETRTVAPGVVTPATRRLVLSLPARDFESLGLLAVKRGVTRHVLAAEAMTLYFEKLAREYHCACIGQCRSPCAAE